MRNLANLFSNDDKGPVAWRAGEIIYFPDFQQAVIAVTEKMKNTKRAVLICQDSYNFTVGLFALLRAGAIVVLPSNPHMQINDQVIDDAFITTATSPSSKEGLGVVAGLGYHPPTPSLKEGGIDPNRMALEFFTSGSTGEPKKIVKSLQMLQNEAEVIDKLWGDKTAHSTVFATVPHQHFYSLIFKIIWPLVSGRPFSTIMHGLWEGLLPELLQDAIIISSPAHLERLGGIRTNARPSRIFCAGAKLSAEAAHEVKETFGCLPTEIFGSTETGAIATRQQIIGDEDWQPLPGIKIKTDENSAMQVLSPFIGPEFFATSDIIKQTDKGFSYLGRADRIVKIAGKRVSLPEVEQALLKLEIVQAAAVVYLKDRERLAAAVVLKDKQDLSNFRMGRVLREALMPYFEPASIPKLWRFVENLPTHMLGKQRDTDIIALFDL